MISKPTRFTLFAFVIASVLVAGCGTSDRENQTVRLLTHKEFQLPEEALKEFTEKTGIEVLGFLEDNATSLVNLLERSSDNPVADVVLGIDSLERRRVTE